MMGQNIEVGKQEQSVQMSSRKQSEEGFSRGEFRANTRSNSTAPSYVLSPSKSQNKKVEDTETSMQKSSTKESVRKQGDIGGKSARSPEDTLSSSQSPATPPLPSQDTKIGNGQRPMGMNSKEDLVGGNLEGAISSERGHLLGNAQSPASYLLAPTTTTTTRDWSDSRSVHSASTSILEPSRSRGGSVASLSTMPNKPSLQGLDSSESLRNGRASKASSFGGSYLLPLLGPRNSESNWVSPLDVHFTRPSTPQSHATSQQSYHPLLQFPEPAAKRPSLNPTPAGSTVPIKSETASFSSATPMADTSKSSYFNFNFFDPEASTRPSPQSALPTFPAPNDHSAPAISDTTAPLGPQSPDHGPNQNDKARTRDSTVSKQSVSISQPATSDFQTHRVTSSIYSTTFSFAESSTSRPKSPSLPPNATTNNQRHSRSSLSRTQNSLRHSRRSSTTEKRHSRERDQMHYDPTSHHRNHSGSVQGRNVDFDRPRSSPFSNANATPHSNNSSISTDCTTEIPWQKPSDPEPEPKPRVGLAVGFGDSDRLSVAMMNRTGRSVSIASSVGFGEFYDAYYRQSQIGGFDTHNNLNGSARGSIVQDGIGMASSSGGVGVGHGNTGKRPMPLKFGGGVAETIVEVNSPLPSPAPPIRPRFEGLGGKF